MVVGKLILGLRDGLREGLVSAAGLVESILRLHYRGVSHDEVWGELMKALGMGIQLEAQAATGLEAFPARSEDGGVSRAGSGFWAVGDGATSKRKRQGESVGARHEAAGPEGVVGSRSAGGATDAEVAVDGSWSIVSRRSS